MATTAIGLLAQSACNDIVAQAETIKAFRLEFGTMIQKHDATAQEHEKFEPLFEKIAQKFDALSAQLRDEIVKNDSELTTCEDQYITTIIGLKKVLESANDQYAVESLNKEWALENEQYKKMSEEINTAFCEKLKILRTDLDDGLKQHTQLREHCIQQLSKASPINTPTYQHPITYITIKYNAGFGNSLSICGTGPQMSWDVQKALPLRCVGDDIWVYETNANFQEFNFKIVLNNKFWEKGSDHLVRQDNPQQITPHFAL